MNNSQSSILNSQLKKYLSLNLCFLIILILLRFFEYFYTGSLHALPDGSFILSLTGLLYDLYLFFIVSAALVIPYLGLYFISRKLANIFYEIIVSIIIAGYMALLHYFAVQQIPLGRDLFGYTLAEINQTVSASGELNLITFISFVIFIGLFLLFARLFRFSKYNNFTLWVFYLLTIVSVFCMSSFLIPDSKNYKKDLDFYLVNNKLNYFIYDNCFKETSTTKLQNPNSKSQNLSYNNNQNLTYISDEYPFLRLEDTKDVLGQFFNKSPEKPNIVIFFVESLSAAFTGKDAYLGSFTPFLDSLIDHSLYWKNFLSAAGRTFGVTPSVLGSLPFGTHGFLDLGAQAPDHLSLVRLLEENGYYSSFYYGGDPHFDLMDVFYKRQHIDYIIHQKDYGNGYSKFPANSGGFSWGYTDRDMFRKSFEIMKKTNKEPRLDIYMTLATHDPFLIPNMDYYIRKFNERMQLLGLAGSEKANDYIKDKEKYACILYMDDAFRYFFNQYKKRDDFNNTIFIITGDHRMAEIPLISKIDKFHVRLIIYSPLLKQNQVFESVSSHLDITPTLLAFLRDNYQMKFPPKSCWLGQGIDVNKSFRNIHSLAFMWDKNDLFNFLDKEYFINENQLFRLSRDMNIDPINNDTIFARVNARFNKFKELNNYVCQNNKLYPDKNPIIDAHISLLFHSHNPQQTTNGVILDKLTLNQTYSNLYILTTLKPLNPADALLQQLPPKLNISILNSKNEKISETLINLTNQVNLKNIINLTGKNQDPGSYINIQLNYSGSAKFDYDILSIIIYGEK